MPISNEYFLLCDQIAIFNLRLYKKQLAIIYLSLKTKKTVFILKWFQFQFSSQPRDVCSLWRILVHSLQFRGILERPCDGHMYLTYFKILSARTQKTYLSIPLRKLNRADVSRVPRRYTHPIDTISLARRWCVLQQKLAFRCCAQRSLIRRCCPTPESERLSAELCENSIKQRAERD